MRTIVVVEYDPAWPTVFESLRREVWPVVADVATSIEHVGSTSVPGLAAKPIIDVSVVVPSAQEIPFAIERLATLGYVHEGNLGVQGREAFVSPVGLPPHHLYVCPQGRVALMNFLTVREYLRSHPEVAREYGALKMRLAAEFPHEIDQYIAGKTDLILRILREAGFSKEELKSIERANRVESQ